MSARRSSFGCSFVLRQTVCLYSFDLCQTKKKRKKKGVRALSKSSRRERGGHAFVGPPLGGFVARALMGRGGGVE